MLLLVLVFVLISGVTIGVSVCVNIRCLYSVFVFSVNIRCLYSVLVLVLISGVCIQC